MDQAMPRLVGTGLIPEMRGEAGGLLKKALGQPALADRPALAAGLWLYVDELDRSHTISQHIDDPTGAFWHGIMHRREGDFSNSHYWFRQVGDHPALADLPGHDPHTFIDAIAAAEPDDVELVGQQRREWATLFSWCARQ
jgi:hypothetical protein